MKKLYVAKPSGDNWVFMFFISDTQIANKIASLEEMPFTYLKGYTVGNPNIIRIECHWDKRKLLWKLEKEFEVIDLKEYNDLANKYINNKTK